MSRPLDPVPNEAIDQPVVVGVLVPIGLFTVGDTVVVTIAVVGVGTVVLLLFVGDAVAVADSPPRIPWTSVVPAMVGRGEVR
jgi:hypothetical protein